jgi:hypothetical protein
MPWLVAGELSASFPTRKELVVAFTAVVKHVAADKSLIVELPSGDRLTNVCTLFGWEPIVNELAVLVGLESGGYCAMGPTYNHISR